jgi:hypothetical protein
MILGKLGFHIGGLSYINVSTTSATLSRKLMTILYVSPSITIVRVPYDIQQYF